MKSINSIQEAQQAINELYNRLDTLSIKNWDRRQTRIVNAHPSVDPYDYVVRKELDEKVGNTVTSVTNGLYEKVVFGIGIGSYITVDTDVCPHYISLYTLSFKNCLAKCKIAPAGADLKVQFYKNGTTALFNAPLTIPVGSTSVVASTDFAVTDIAYKDWITCSVIQSNSGNVSNCLTVYMRFEIVGVFNG